MSAVLSAELDALNPYTLLAVLERIEGVAPVGGASTGGVKEQPGRTRGARVEGVAVRVQGFKQSGHEHSVWASTSTLAWANDFLFI